MDSLKLRGCPPIPVTRKITDIKCEDGTQRFVPLPEKAEDGSGRYTDRDMPPKVLKVQEAHVKKPHQKKKAK